MGFRKYTFFSIYLASTFFLRCHVASGILLGPWQQSRSTRTGSCGSSGSMRLEPPADSLRVLLLLKAEATKLWGRESSGRERKEGNLGHGTIISLLLFSLCFKTQVTTAVKSNPATFFLRFANFSSTHSFASDTFFTSYFFVQPVVFF